MKFIFTFILTLFISFTYSQSAEEHIEEAKKLSEDGGWPQCIEKATLAISIDSTNTSYYWVRSKCYLNEYDFDKAITDVNRAISLSDTPTANMYGRLASIYYHKGKDIAHQAIVVKKDNTENNSNKPNPNKATKEKLKYYNEARLLYETALHTFGKAIEVNPEIESDFEDLIYMTNRELKKINREINNNER